MAVVRWGSASHEGQMRAQNEDHAHAGDGLFVVADGMGGHLAGEVASEIAVTRLEQRLPAAETNRLDDLVEAITIANTEIFDSANDDPDRAGMGTTVTAIAVVDDPLDGEAFAIANVGDSRSYVLRHGRLRQLTVDHSFVQELIAEGAISRDEARTHPRRNIVTRALGIEPHVRVDSWTMPIIRGDRLVLCSDGLVDEITDDAITEVLRAHEDDPAAAANALVDAANEAGGRDNITVVVVDVVEGDEPPDPTEEFDVVPLWTDEDLDTTGEHQIVSDPTDDELADLAELVAATGGGDDDLDDGSPTALDAAVAAETGDGAGGDAKPRRRLAGVARFVLVLGVAAVLILGFAILAAWARSGYFVAFDDDGEVVVYQGRKDGVLWFEPTREAVGDFTRDELDDTSVDLVERRPEFSSQASAERFVAERLEADAGTDGSGETDGGAGTVTTAPATTNAPPTTSEPAGTEP